MKLFGEVKGYIIHKPDGGNYTLCKILKEYGYEKEDKERCINDLSALLCNKTTERKLIKENQKRNWKDEDRKF